ncbi:MAG: uroporphyrinogen-III synthase [Candidatus Sedimenticola sp. 6PFRAG1]
MANPGASQPCDLAGLGVLVTRAQHQAQGLCRQIREHEGRSISFPAIEIGGPADPAATGALLERINQYHTLLFISPNAVAWALKLLGDKGLPEGVQIGAVGRATAQALARAGCPVDIVPEEHFDSEALLATEALSDVEGRNVLIFRGRGGRALLGDSLSARGAKVDYAEVYQRICPDADTTELLLRWDDVGVVTATSNAILDNLLSLFDVSGRSRLLATPLVVVSERMRGHARDLGFRQVLLSAGAEDHNILAAICDWFQQQA